MSDAPRPSARLTLNRFGTLAVLTLLPSLAVFGWRALLVFAGVLASNVVARAILREPDAAPRLWPRLLPADALLLAALLPAETAAGPLWPLVPAAGITLALLQRARCALPALPFDTAIPAALAMHAAAISFGSALVPRASLDRDALFVNDIARARDLTFSSVEPWYERRPAVEGGEGSAQRVTWAATALDDYLRDRIRTSVSSTANLDNLIRDRLPPLEDLVLIGHPMPLGQASGVFLIAVVLWGAHRRTIDWRVPIIAGAFAYAALIVLPIPTSFSNFGGNWRFLAAARADVGPSTALTFAHYLVFASPLPLALGLFASRLDAKPLRPGAMMAWAATVGVASAAATLYVSVSVGALIVLAVAPLAARGFDRALARRPMRLPQ
jgi:hypothetical protein